MLPRRSLPLFAVLAIGIALARAAPARDAAALVDALVREGLQALNDKQLTPRDRQERFATILENDFDVARIGRFTAGRYWNAASEADRQQFVKVFERWVIITYSDRFSGYSGEGVKVTGSRPETETTVTVSSQLIRSSGGAAVKVDWRVRRDGVDDYRVIDVAVEGVSMLVTQREEFASVVQNYGGTLAGLTRALEQKVAGGGTASPPR
jgi:phospholipid transport system substrate-binding protein